MGYPGNSHDSVILQPTALWDDIKKGQSIPEIAKKVGNVNIPPLIVADSAFPFERWLMKPFTNANTTPMQRYFNYRLSRARMVTECAYGQLKGRWRILLRKNESQQNNARAVTLACVVLHNICIDRGDAVSRKMDLSLHPQTGEKRDREVIREMLDMTRCLPIRDTCRQANLVRDCLVDLLWTEEENT